MKKKRFGFLIKIYNLRIRNVIDYNFSNRFEVNGAQHDAFSPRGENLFGNFKSLKWNYGTESIVFNAIGSRFERNLQKYANAIPV